MAQKEVIDLYYGKRTLILTGLVTILLGTALHFLFALLPNPATALIAPINESLWEHGKLVFWPYLLAAWWLNRGRPGGIRPWLLTLPLLCTLLVGMGWLYHIVLGGSFQLNRWNAVGDLALKAGVPFYASFTQSGITVYNDSGYSGDDERIPRNHKDVCNARIADALLCKAAGCMYTMGMHHEVQFPWHLCEPYDAKYNRTADKRYFVSYTNDRAANNFLKDGFKYRVPPSLLSGAPANLAKGMAKYTIEVWDDFAALAKDGIVPQISLVTEASLPSGIEIDVTFNGKPVKAYRKRAGTQFYELSPKLVKIGGNEVTVKAKGKNKRGQTAKFGNVVVEVAYPKAK